MYPNAKAETRGASGRCAPARVGTIGGALVLALFWAGSGMTAAPIDDLRSASDAAGATVKKAVAGEDSESLASVFTENGSITVPTGQTIRGRTTIRSMAALMMMTWGGGALALTRDTLDVRDSTGHEIGRFDFRRSVKNQPDQVWTGNYTVVWEKEAGAWKIARVSGLLAAPGAGPKKSDGR